MKDVKWVNNLKLRASYGETGNDETLDSDSNSDYYPYQTLYGLGYKMVMKQELILLLSLILI